MPVQYQWIDEPNILAIEYIGHINTDDIRSVVQICLLALTDHPVYFMVDFTQSTSIDPHIIELSSFSEWLYHRNARWFAYVQVTGIYKSLLQFRHQSNVKFFHERAEAEAFLREAIQVINGTD